MRVLKENCRRCLQLPKICKQSLSAPKGQHSSHCQNRGGPAAILADSHSSWFITPYYNLSGFIDFSKLLFKPSGVLEKIKRSVVPLSNTRRGFSQKTPQESSKPLPRLLYIQNPLIWVSNKLDFRFLRVNWDPRFTEAEFSRGCRQAISTVTHFLSLNKFENLKPLFTKNALLNLRRDVEIMWSDEVRRNIGLAPDDVQLIIPRKLHFRQSDEPKLLEQGYSPAYAAVLATKPKIAKKLCDIDVLFIALKYMEARGYQQSPLCFVDIVARFHRNYSETIPPNWTISAFKVRRFNVIPQKD